MKRNDTIPIEITGYTSEGWGVARAPDGMAVFVRDAIAGEAGLAQIDHVGRTAAHAHLTRLDTVSPHRTARACPLGKRCGGCAFWHMEYQEELRLKAQRVRDALTRIGGWDPGEVPILGGETCRGYRNKAQYPVAPGPNDPIAGFFEARTHRVLPVARCLIQPPAADAVKDAVLAWMRLWNIPAYDEKNHAGLVRHIYVRTARSGAVLACVVANGPPPVQAQALPAALRQAVPELCGLIWNENRRRGNAVLGEKFVTLWGQDYLKETLCGLCFRLSVRSFFQVNRAQAERLYETALDLAELHGTETVLDLYCGTGTITLCAAGRAGRVYGVEAVASAVADARKNAVRNGVENAEFLCADAGEAAQRFAQEGIRPEVILVDPPRKGLAPQVIEAMAAMAPRRIVYVSCDPATMARDIARLQAHAYQPQTARAVDMFPRCAHVETVVCLSKQQPDDATRVGLDLDELEVTPAESRTT